MGYANYVGRIGALAVALGLGAALAGGPAIAGADTTGSSSTDSASTSSPTDSTPPSTSASTDPTSTGTASSSTDPSTTSTSSTTDPQVPVVQASGGANTTVTSSGTAVAVEPTTAASGHSATPTNTTTASTPVAVSTASSSSKFTIPTAASAPASPTASPATANVPVTAAKTAAAVPQVSVARVLTTTASPTLTSTVVAPPTPVAPVAPVAPGNLIVNLVSGLLSAIGFNAQAGTGPVTPAEAPTLWTLLAWVRREFDRAFNLAPAAMTTSLVQSPNLLVNPGAELGDPSLSGYSSVTVPGWTVTGTPTVIEYGTPRRLPWPLGSPGPTLPAFLGFPSAVCAPAGSGAQFFGGGNVATSSLTQTVNLSAAASDIDGGAVPYTLSGALGGFVIDPSAASVTVDFLGDDQSVLGTGRLMPVTVLDRWLQTELLERDTSGVIPVGTRSARVVVTFTDCNPFPGNYNNAYADDLSFTVGAALPAPPPPTPPEPKVGPLDHVFMVYLENKGYTDIVGSPNAPYINSLINTYGLGSNYYALTHPSDPNYYPILGGSDFGTNYNCAANCFDQPNLADNIELAQKTWAEYMEGGGGYSTPTDRLPFLAFSDIYNYPARVAAHLFDLSQMGHDLETPSTAPNFVWFAASDHTNMEGPTDTLDGVIQWAISQLLPPFLGGHQYNVAAGDKWLSETLPVIMNSATWQDPSQKSAIFVTFDEDYNNLSLGNGNQGNHIVTVVIPSPGAVGPNGMRGDHFVAKDHNNHYSLLRTIELSLGLPPLTNNDKYAQPMNEYWV